MARVLHVVQAVEARTRPADGAGLDAAALACRAMIDATPEHEHRIVSIASTPGERRLDALGVFTHDRLTPPLGVPALAWRGMRALNAARPAPDLVQAWSDSALVLARVARPFGARVLGVPPEFPVPIPRPSAHAGLRGRFGLDPSAQVIIAMSDPPSAGDMHRLQFTLGLLEFCGINAAGIVPAGSSGVHRLRRFHRMTGVRTPVVFSDLPAWALFPACDAAILLSPADRRPSVLPTDRRLAIDRAVVRSAIMHGVPVIAPRRGAIEDDPYDGLVTGHRLARRIRACDIARSLLLDIRRRTTARGRADTGLPQEHARRANEGAIRAIRERWERALEAMPKTVAVRA